MRRILILMMICVVGLIFPRTTQAIGPIIDSSNVFDLTLMEIFDTDSPVYSLAWTPDNSTVVFGMANGNIGQETWTSASITLPQMIGGHSDIVQGVAVSGDGNFVYSGSMDGTVRVWDITSGVQLLAPGISEPTGSTPLMVLSVAAHPIEWNWVAYASGRPAVNSPVRQAYWDILGGGGLPSLEGHTNFVFDIAFDPSGNYVATGAADASVRVYGAYLGGLISNDNTSHTRRVRAVAFDRSGANLASVGEDRAVWIRPVLSPGEPALIDILPDSSSGNWATAVDFSFYGDLLAVGDGMGTLRIYQIPSSTVPTPMLLVEIQAHTDQLHDLAFSPDGTMLATAGFDNTVKLWNVGAILGDPPVLPTESAAGLCPGAPPSQVEVGIRARVTYTDGTQLRVRRSPGGSRYAAMDEGTEFDIIGGPACANGYTWWEIQTDDGIRGWSAEGDSESYFMEPVSSSSGTSGASISGTVWHDICNGLGGDGCIGLPDGSWLADGFRASVEPVISGVTVQLGLNRCAAFTPAGSAITASDGSYTFTGLEAGTYCVYVISTTPQNSSVLIPGTWSYPIAYRNNEVAYAEVTVGTGETITDIDFGWDFQFSP